MGNTKYNTNTNKYLQKTKYLVKLHEVMVFFVKSKRLRKCIILYKIIFNNFSSWIKLMISW